MATLEHGSLGRGGSSVKHLDLCLMCRHCESICPNAVAYGEMLVNIRAQKKGGASFVSRFGRGLLIRLLTFRLSRRVMIGMARKISLKIRPSANSLFRILRGLGTLPPRQTSQIQKAYLAGDESSLSDGREKVGVFLGCVAEELDRATIESVLAVLEALQCDPVIPKEATCCGAIWESQGFVNKARYSGEAAIRAFVRQGVKKVLVAATGCVESLRGAVHLSGEEIEIIEVCEFLANHPGLPSIPLRYVAETALVHEPCTMRNVLKSQDSVERMLAFLPGLEWTALPGNDQCCGAAGLYGVLHSRMATKLAEGKARVIDERKPDVVLTTNWVCGAHIGAVMPDGRQVEIIHPVTLLARRLQSYD